MAETFVERRAKLQTISRLLQELIEVNERGLRLEGELLTQGLSTVEIGNTVNKMLDVGGPCTALAEAVGDTVTDRIVNLLNSAIFGSVDWTYTASS